MSDKKIILQYTTLTTPVPDFIYEGLKSFSQAANSYHPQPKELIQKLATKHDLPQEMIHLTAGADEAIYLFGLAYGTNVYAFTPTYITYEEIMNVGAKVTFINALENTNYKISTENLADASLIFIANPNNPFGFTEKEKIVELIENNPQAIIVIDEVYAEFADLSVIDVTTKYKNLAVIRSFSKSFSLAGNRVAYVVANPEVLKKISMKTQWASLSYLSAGAAITALDHEQYFLDVIGKVGQTRESFQTFLKEKNFTIFPTVINAALIKFSNEYEGTRFVTYLNDNDFIVSHGNGGSNVGLDKSFVRIAIGTEEEMEKLKKVISNFR